jgi:hypothetical protein
MTQKELKYCCKYKINQGFTLARGINLEANGSIKSCEPCNELKPQCNNYENEYMCNDKGGDYCIWKNNFCYNKKNTPNLFQDDPECKNITSSSCNLPPPIYYEDTDETNEIKILGMKWWVFLIVVVIVLVVLIISGYLIYKIKS